MTDNNFTTRTNTTPEYVGQVVTDPTDGSVKLATNTKKSSDWQRMGKFASGTATVTAGGGDVAITVPFDWTGGFLLIVKSTTTSEWAMDDSALGQVHFASYDSLTTAAYTNDEVIQLVANGTSSLVQALDQTTAAPGLPNAATTTTFTLDDDGATTSYIKWFVWA